MVSNARTIKAGKYTRMIEASSPQDEAIDADGPVGVVRRFLPPEPSLRVDSRPSSGGQSSSYFYITSLMGGPTKYSTRAGGDEGLTDTFLKFY